MFFKQNKFSDIIYFKDNTKIKKKLKTKLN